MKNHYRIMGAVGIVAALLCLSAGASKPARAGDVELQNNSGEFSMHVVSLRERRFKRVVMQRYDYSCGAAAVATLLKYDYGYDTDERDPFIKMIEHGDKKTIQKVGFSMLDMKHYFQSLGLHPVGVKLSLDDVEKLGVPGVVLITQNGYKHFVVLTSVDDDRVLVADPALGMQIVDREKFGSMWDGIMMVIRDHPNVGHQNFTEQAFYDVRPAAPIGVTRSTDGLSLYTQNLYLHNLLLIAF